MACASAMTMLKFPCTASHFAYITRTCAACAYHHHPAATTLMLFNSTTKSHFDSVAKSYPCGVSEACGMAAAEAERNLLHTFPISRCCIELIKFTRRHKNVAEEQQQHYNMPHSSAVLIYWSERERVKIYPTI
jgi:hypothetical protein